jgi:hypothetical protein
LRPAQAKIFVRPYLNQKPDVVMHTSDHSYSGDIVEGFQSEARPKKDFVRTI